ncbi:MAG TPA: methyltransferase domain-containing protein [Candidatus Saccharimonadales bacterium]|nr:methyltransferase domain-containing protein [Candidatus Saccharimonadales bacterium]
MMKIESHALLFKDFESAWYKKWAAELKQDKDHLDGHAVKANKFWQNAIICQMLFKRRKLHPGVSGIGFGVGQERLPAVFAKYGVKVTATDQDYSTKKASHWSEHELATGLQSLNSLEICKPALFSKSVHFMQVDMAKIPSRFSNKYDFLWSNCALGHLGSISEGLRFIEESLHCLKPGGAAVHTTEVNILSDAETVESGDTVIFRLQDIYKLYTRLTESGYVCAPLDFYLGRTQDDFRVSMRPKFGNDYSKIQVGGYISTQVVLIIVRPRINILGGILKKIRLKRLEEAHKNGEQEIINFGELAPGVSQFIEAQKASTDPVHIQPLKRRMTIYVRPMESKEVFIEYVNQSSVTIYSRFGHPVHVPPVVLATGRPRDRISVFMADDWISKNRPSSDYYSKAPKGKFKSIDHVQPKKKFAFRVVINPHKLASGTYTETFSAVQEGARWIPNSSIDIRIKIV